ncbi:hypothetical protein HanIR_Chr13g0640461 [Helianthus annuus]|nr:hypothetical protein HanIR_Chr13g0640461 [Helianthus annuus]
MCRHKHLLGRQLYNQQQKRLGQFINQLHVLLTCIKTQINVSVQLIYSKSDCAAIPSEAILVFSLDLHMQLSNN